MFKVLCGVYGSFISTGAAEGGVAHPYLINDNNIDRILHYAKCDDIPCVLHEVIVTVFHELYMRCVEQRCKRVSR